MSLPRRPFLTLCTALAITVPTISAVAADAEGPASTRSSLPTRFTIVVEGTEGKPDLLLIPGLTSSREVWAAEAARLAPEYRLHLLQVNGFAGQPAGANATGDALLPAIVEQLHDYIAAHAMRPMIVGHSLGGLLALMLAEKYPGDVSRMVIVDTLPFFGLMFGPQATVDSVRPTAESMRDGMMAQTPAQRQTVQKQTAETLALSPEGRERVEADGLASDPQIVARAMFEDLQTDLRPDLSTIEIPALVLYAYDPTLTFPNGVKPTQDMADRITSDAYKTMPKVKLVRVDGSRHFIMFDQPLRFHELLRAFLADPESPGAMTPP